MADIIKPGTALIIFQIAITAGYRAAAQHDTTHVQKHKVNITGIGGKDIRGYTNGKYRGNQVYAAQAEYRWNFYKRWGAVGFFGVAFTEAPSSAVLPGGGVGVRFKAIRSRNINIGVDGALGKDDKGIYFRINEAF
ncbi:hypothetical protein SAMN05444266_104147 [Chitinophaga jiangningensis]|uniref:Surface antigen n=1 Tax=Chitinophaga jiangningensis TaxID=1419482 RepID=A0A1M7C1K6_9BACT|nr:hypothetical protein [Chitinophaga jiangningensis]SHL60719.1 hypothetical protein SAMN05444266_104147 [Chitinophaga jiangningensis]